MATTGSRSFGRSRPHKRHLVRGTGGVQAEVADLRSDVEQSFCDLEASGQLGLNRIDVVPPTINDDDTQGFVTFSKWVDSVAGREYTCISNATGAAVWHETTNLGVVPGGIVASVFGRTGVVISAPGDYLASQVTNDSGVVGAFVSDALDTLAGLIPPVAPVDSVHGRVGVVVGADGDYLATQVVNDSAVSGTRVASALDTLNTLKADKARIISAGMGLTGGGDLSADRTINVGAHADGSIEVAAATVRVGVLAADSQHGSRGGGGLHQDATPVSSGFMSFSDKAKLNSIAFGAQENAVTSVFGRIGAVSAVLNDYLASLVGNDSGVAGATVKDALNNLLGGSVPTGRVLTSGAGLVGGGDLSADRTLDIVANVDGSIVVNANDLQVGVLASDAQHGVRGGSVLHAVATIASAGFMSPEDKLKLDSIFAGITSPWQDQVIDKDLSAPPGGPSAGDRYIVAAGGSGDWTGHDDDVAVWTGAAWGFVTPEPGFAAYVLDESSPYQFDVSWTPVASSQTDAQVPLVGIIGSPTYASQADRNSTTGSAGLVAGGDVTDDLDGTVTVSAGTGQIRATDSDVAPLLSYDFATTPITPTDNALTYLYVEYNGGSPQVVGTGVERTDLNTNNIIGTVYRYGTTIHITPRQMYIANISHALTQRLIETDNTRHALGVMASESGVRNLAITSGFFWLGRNRVTFPPFDTAITGTFFAFYQDSVQPSGWSSSNQTQINNTQWDDGSDTLATLGVNRYGVHWIYTAIDGDVYSVFGRGDYTLALAQDALPPPNLPPHFIEHHAVLAAKIIIQKDAVATTSVESAFGIRFSASGIADHSDLSGVNANNHHNELHTVASHSDTTATGAQLNTLVSGGDADALHKHPASKNRFYLAETNAGVAATQYRVRVIAATAASAFSFALPTDLTTIVELSLIGWPAASYAGTGAIDLTSSYGAVGELTDGGASESASLTGLTGVQHTLNALDISSVFAGATAGDLCGVTVDHVSGLAVVNYLGILLRYT